jgi:hypothetical protein
MEDIKILNKKSNSVYFSSFLFFSVVTIFTIILYIYNAYLASDIKDIQKNISVMETNIKEVESDKNIQIYSLLQINSKVIKLYENMNNITKFINNLNLLKEKYDLTLE